jgi:hypothetical protein
LLILEHMLEKTWCERLEVRASFIQKYELLEFYKWSSAASLRFRWPYTDPIDFTRYTLVAAIRSRPANTNYRVITPAPVTSHAIVTTKHSRLTGITPVGSLVH